MTGLVPAIRAFHVKLGAGAPCPRQLTVEEDDHAGIDRPRSQFVRRDDAIDQCRQAASLLRVEELMLATRDAASLLDTVYQKKNHIKTSLTACRVRSAVQAWQTGREIPDERPLFPPSPPGAGKRPSVC